MSAQLGDAKVSCDPADGVEFIGIPEWCRRVGCSLDSGYRAARRGQIPGLFTIGRLRRVNWEAFVTATFVGGDGERRPGREAPGGRPVSR